MIVTKKFENEDQEALLEDLAGFMSREFELEKGEAYDIYRGRNFPVLWLGGLRNAGIYLVLDRPYMEACYYLDKEKTYGRISGYSLFVGYEPPYGIFLHYIKSSHGVLFGFSEQREPSSIKRNSLLAGVVNTKKINTVENVKVLHWTDIWSSGINFYLSEYSSNYTYASMSFYAKSENIAQLVNVFYPEFECVATGFYQVFHYQMFNAPIEYGVSGIMEVDKKRFAATAKPQFDGPHVFALRLD